MKKVVRRLWGYMLTVAMIISMGCNVPVAYAEEYWGEEIASSQDAYDEVASAQDAQTDTTNLQDEVSGVLEDAERLVNGEIYIDVNELNLSSQRTKEKITQKFAQAVQNPQASLYVSQGSSVAPYKPYVLTESAQKSASKLANYYRYLAGLGELYMAEDYIWEESAYAIVLTNGYYNGWEFDEERGTMKPLDMSDEFYDMGYFRNDYFIDNSVPMGALKERDLIDCYREYLQPHDNIIVPRIFGRDTYSLPFAKSCLLNRNAYEIAIGVSEKHFSMYCETPNSGSTFSGPITMWPSSGNFPMEEIDVDMLWCFSGQDNFVLKSGSPTVEILDIDTGKVYQSKVTKYGDRDIYYTPPAVDSYKDKSYKVTIKGYSKKSTGDSVTFEYTIDFFSYTDVKTTINGKEYVYDQYGNLFTYPEININYRTHVQTFGWEGNASDIKTWKSNGTMSGTSGKAKRLEGINIVVNPKTADDKLDLGIQYTTHCQSYGWLPWSANGEMNGTEGEAKRLEAIKIQLTGEHANLYDVYYRVHAQSYGWLGWAKNGAPAGTAGYGKRLEGIQIVVVKKGASYDQKKDGIVSVSAKAFEAKAGESPIVNYAPTSNTNPVVPGANTVNVAYRTHVQSYGWQAWKYNGQMSGTSGEAKRLEGINIELRNKDCSGGIVYTTHVQSYGWQGKLSDQSTWKKNGEMSGTSGEAKRLEAICINLTGDMSKKYDIYYRVHAQSYGWLGWAKNGAPAGTAGYGKRLEGIQIVLVPKGGAAPGNHQGVVSANASAYVEK